MLTVSDKLPWYAQGDPWVLTQIAWEPDKNHYLETIFTQSNGYMGIRGYTEETDGAVDACREGYVGGLFGTIEGDALKILDTDYPWAKLQMVSLPELFGCALRLDGENFVMSAGSIEFFSRSLNMRNGVLTRRLVWLSPGGRRTRLEFDRFLSAADPHLGMQRIVITPENWSGEAVLDFTLDGETPSYFRCGDRALEPIPQALLEDSYVDGGRFGAPSLTCAVRGTGHRIAVASEVAGADHLTLGTAARSLNQKVLLPVQQGEFASLTHAVAVVTSRDVPGGNDVSRLASQIAADAAAGGYDQALAESEVIWKQRWDVSDIAIDGPARDQAYLRFSAFSMLQMAPFHTDHMSVPARAYAFNRYHGLYYWDSETFLLPCYLHTHPGVAKNLLDFRYHTLDGARRTAQNLDSPGACFPWMTDSDDGAEQAPWGIGDYLWHQNADIAYAIDQYVAATGDVAFMVEKGLEVLIESARFWMSRFDEDKGGVLHLHDTVGPDELDKHGRDNGYTSLLARRHLRLVVQWIDALRRSHGRKIDELTQRLEVREPEIRAWLGAAERLAVPNVPGRNFPLQDEFLLGKEPLDFEGLTADEAFAKRHTHRVVKQADIILAMYLLQDEFTVEQMREAYDFYEPMTLHFSSLSYNTHSIIATKIGRDDQAYAYFMKAAGLDLDNLRDATRDGLHAAALGGTWQTVVYGFLGMRCEGDTVVFRPRIPECWKMLSLTIMFRGYRLKLELSYDDHQVHVEDVAGAAGASLRIDGKTYKLKDQLNIASVPGIAAN